MEVTQLTIVLSVVGFLWFATTVVMLCIMLSTTNAQSAYMWRWLIVSTVGTILSVEYTHFIVFFLWGFSFLMWGAMIMLSVWRVGHPPNTAKLDRKQEIIAAIRR